MASTSTMSRTFPTLKYLAALFRWFFRSRRRLLTAAAVLLSMIAAPLVWWSIQLMGLPDIGDPFDLEAFRSLSIPDDTNAFVLYRQAAERFKSLDTSGQSPDRKIDPFVPWSVADPLVHRWVEENREAMEIYRRGTERPDMLDPDLVSHPDWHPVYGALRSLLSLALLEASRLEDQGDPAGAWVWYRAALRSTYHMSLRTTASGRAAAESYHGLVRRRISVWAADDQTTSALLRRALDDAVACGAFQPSESYTLKATFPLEEAELDRPSNPGRQALIEKLTDALRSESYRPDRDQIRALADAWRFWRREPERSRRVLRLAFANWLAYEELPPGRRTPPDPDASDPSPFYALGPEAPAKARALSPEALDRWLKTTYEAQDLVRFWLTYYRPLRARERAGHRALVLLLAGELYHRDRGSYPPTDEALVGPYLKNLPDGTGESTNTSARPATGSVQ